MKFSELQLQPALQANLEKIQFIECTPIQDQAIPLLRKGKDISGLAQTGTGKTGAFLIPLIDRILKAMKPEKAPDTPEGGDAADSETVAFTEWKKKNYVLVLVPTRELCEQVQENAKKLTEGLGISSVAVYGGTTYEKQVAGLKQGVEIVIATPGRFIDLYKEHIADLGQVRAVVFDEADRMFDMGFRDDMKFILKRLPRERQFLVFSATLNFEVLNVAYEFGAEPIEINISRDQAKAENVKDAIIHLGQEDKPKYLLSLCKRENPRQAIIFSNYKHNVERIARFLTSNGIPAMGISSLLTQGQRNRVMAQFRAENEKNILVATDLAARGLDILGVDLVLNFDLPEDPENYVHRIGRTGRAGSTGHAFSLVSDRDVDSLQRIEEYLGNKVEAIWIDDTELVQEFQPFPRDEGRPRGPASRQMRGGDRGGRPSGGGDRGRGDRDRGRHPGRGRHGGGDRQYAQGGGGDRRPRPNDGADRRPRPNGPDRAAQGAQGGGQGQHRDRSSGRHRDGQQQQHGRAQGQHPGRDQRPRRQGGGGQPQQRGRNEHPNRSRHGQRPQGGSHRPNQQQPMSASGANKGLGSKVSGFFKKLFGNKES